MFRTGDWAWSLEHRQACRIAQEDNVWEACDQVVCPLDSVKPLDGRRGWSKERVEQHNRLLAEPAPVERYLEGDVCREVFEQVEAATREQGRQIYQELVQSQRMREQLDRKAQTSPELVPLLLLRVEGRGGDG